MSGKIKVEILHKIEDKSYSEISGFLGYNIYFTKNWHSFLHKTFAWEVSAVVGKVEDKLAFFLPFVSKTRLGFTKQNISLPFSHNVGIAVNDNFLDYYNLFIESLSPNFVNFEIHDEIKHGVFSGVANNYITEIDFSYYDNVKELYDSLDYSSVKYMINRSKKSGCVVDDRYCLENFEDFYKLEFDVRKRQGSPIYPRDFFRNIYSEFLGTGFVNVMIARIDNKSVAGVIFFNFNGVTVYAYSASLNSKEIKKHGITDLLLWSGIESSYNSGARLFDFGTTPLTLPGLKKYKEKWGGSSRLLNYSFYAKGKKKSYISRDSKLVKMSSVILRHMPECLFRFISPYLIKKAI